MQGTIKSISDAEKVVASDVQAAAQKGDWDSVYTLTAIGKKLSQMLVNLSAPIQTVPVDKFVVEVTSGAIAHKYLSATPGISAHVLSVGQPVTLVLGGKEVATVVLKYGRFQDRKNVAKFYGEQHIKPGDQLQLARDTKGRWHVQKI